MKQVKTSLSVFLISSLPFLCFPQTKTFRQVDNALEELNGQRAFNGSVLVAKNGKVIYQKTVGFADIEHRVVINAHTKFELASISKAFTALLVLQLVEKGKLKLDAKVSNYIPEFTRSDSGEITIHHLLSHTSWIQDFVGLNCPFAEWTEKEFIEGLQKTPINFKPGTRFEYASSTYVLLRFIIERVTNASYEDNLQEHILKVAEMTSSGVIHNYAILEDRALGYVGAETAYQNALPIANHDIFLGAAYLLNSIRLATI
jgi:CubicO group peptidase (beta-lactamase class C family)